MKFNSELENETNQRGQTGRVRPLLLAMLLVVGGLLMDKWWWQIGAVIMIVLFVEAYYRYRVLR